MSPDKLIERALKAGIASLLADRSKFERILASSCTAAEIASAWTRFNARTPAVRAAFARTSDSFPEWSVALIPERLQQGFIGDLIERNHATGRKTIGAVHEATVAVFIQTDHPEETRMHDQIGKAIIYGSKLWIVQQGALTINYGSSTDLRPDETYLPETVFTRQQTWEVSGLMATYEEFDSPHDEALIHMAGITVDGIPGGVFPVQE